MGSQGTYFVLFHYIFLKIKYYQFLAQLPDLLLFQVSETNHPALPLWIIDSVAPKITFIYSNYYFTSFHWYSWSCLSSLPLFVGVHNHYWTFQLVQLIFIVEHTYPFRLFLILGPSWWQFHSSVEPHSLSSDSLSRAWVLTKLILVLVGQYEQNLVPLNQIDTMEQHP